MTIQTDFTALMQELAPYRKSEPLRFLQGVAAACDVTAPDLRFLRAEVLHALATGLHDASRLCGLHNEIVVRPDGIFVSVSGILMESSRTGIYLKSSGKPGKNLGEQLSPVLARMNIDVATAVDVGANFGEVSLWLARQYPGARILAIEPSSANVSTFELNKKAQSFPTDAVEIIQQAVSDKAGAVSISKGAGSMNRVLAAAESRGTETVTCDRLDALFDRHGIRTADFVKVDIEGGEPKLKDAVLALGTRVRSYYIEFSQFAPFDEYLALASSLLSVDFECYDESAASRLNTVDEVARYLRAAFAAGPMAVTNLWFIARSRGR